MVGLIICSGFKVVEFTQLYKKIGVSLELKLLKKLGSCCPFDRSAYNLLVKKNTIRSFLVNRALFLFWFALC